MVTFGRQNCLSQIFFTVSREFIKIVAGSARYGKYSMKGKKNEKRYLERNITV
jgi:hypothetical protein